MSNTNDSNRIQLLANSVQIPRIADARGQYIHFNGGVRAGSFNEDAWSIEPLFINKKALHSSAISKKQLQAFARQHKLKAIAFQSFHWRNGSYHSTWTPIISTNKNHIHAPSNTWGNIALNIRYPRLKSFMKNNTAVNINDLATQMDNQDPFEKMARSISSSLRSMDIHVEQIAEFYNEQLINSLVSNIGVGARTSRPMDQNLYAHIHSFYLHLGAARDNLGAWMGIDLFPRPKSKPPDSMARLLDKLKAKRDHPSKILQFLKSENLIELKLEDKKMKWKLSGWLKEASDLRNGYVHSIPFGQKFNEGFGEIKLIDVNIGLFRYQRPFLNLKGDAIDIFDVVIEHYHNTANLFQKAAMLTGQNTDMQTLTEKDITSITVK